MNLLEKIEKDFKKALLEKDKITLSTLSLLKSALKNREIELRVQKKKIDDEEIIKVIKREVKKRREAMEIYKDKRNDLFEKEKKELEILEKYLPEEISEEEIRKIIKEKIDLLGEKNFGRIMKEVMKEIAGRADGKRVAELVKEEIK